MTFLADESVDRQIVVRLRQAGHFVWYVPELESGISDDAVLDLANQDGALLLTADKDFGELVFRQRRITTGVVLIRLAGLTSQAKARLVAMAIQNHETELPGAFTVIAPGVIRFRRLSL